MTQSMPALQDNVMLARRRALATALRGIARNGGVILGLCAIAMLWVGVLHSLSSERAQALRAARQDTANLSRAFEEHIVRSIKAVDQTLLYVRDSYEKDRAKFDLTAWSGNTKFLTDMTFQVVLIDKNGLLVASNLTAAGTRMDLSDREHFWIHRDSPRDELFISKPVFGRASNKWSIQLTRRLSAADGTFDGVVVVSLDPQYLSRFYDSVDLGKQGVVTIAGLDGIVRARAAAGDTTIGQSLAGSRLFEEYGRARSGTFAAESRIDGIKRIFAYREVRGFPLVVSVGVAQDEVLAAYESNRRSYLVLTALLTAVLIAVIVLIARHQARLDRTREALGASEARYAQKSALLEATLEHMGQGIMMVDADRRVQVCNRRAITRLELPEALMATHPHFDDVLRWQWQHGEFGTEGGDVETWLRGFVRSGGIAESPHTYERTRRDGTVLEIRSTPLPEGGVVRTYTDITLRKQTEAGLRAARDEADRAARAKSEFLAMMSHEIRSPMNGLLGIIELLRETPLADDQLGMVTMVHQSATSLLSILDDILDFSKIEAGALGLSTEATPLREMLQPVVEPFAVGAARKGLTLELAIADDVPDCIAVDPLRLRQILVNLIGNALKFTTAGSVRVAVSCEPLAGSGAPGLSFAVSDSGIGMPQEVLERLFQPFTQADASTTKNYGGTGLGLSISRRLAMLLGGDIVVASDVGHGSTFTLSLPLIIAERAVAEAAEPIGKLPDGTRILVAEDQETNRWLIRRQLTRLGAAVEVAEDGLVALATLARGPFNLLITDCHMPRMDGIDLSRRVREMEARDGGKRMPILGLTADVTTRMREACVAAGMDEVASKPINLVRLEAAVARLLLQHRPEAAPAAEPVDAVVFDSGTYVELFADEAEEGREWLTFYLEAAASLIEEIRQSTANDDRAALSAAVHRLAGAALTAGNLRLGARCQRLEIEALNAPRAALVAAVDAAAAEFETARQAVLQFLSIKVAA